jgi:hypothetical protein
MKGVAHRRPAKEGIVVNHPPEERGEERYRERRGETKNVMHSETDKEMTRK